MELDITQLEQAGFTPYYAEEINHGLRPNGCSYKVKFQYLVISDITSSMAPRFLVTRIFNDGIEEQYTFDAIANDTSYVDKHGELVDENDPNKWGTEMEFFRVLLSYGINKDLLVGWQIKLFNRGTFDYPKNRNLN